MIEEVGDFTTAGILLIVTAVVWIGVDVYLFVAGKETISVRINLWSKYFSGIIFLAGFLCGHWFWLFALSFFVGGLFGDTNWQEFGRL